MNLVRSLLPALWIAVLGIAFWPLGARAQSCQNVERSRRRDAVRHHGGGATRFRNGGEG